MGEGTAEEDHPCDEFFVNELDGLFDLIGPVGHFHEGEEIVALADPGLHRVEHLLEEEVVNALHDEGDSGVVGELEKSGVAVGSIAHLFGNGEDFCARRFGDFRLVVQCSGNGDDTDPCGLGDVFDGGASMTFASSHGETSFNSDHAAAESMR